MCHWSGTTAVAFCWRMQFWHALLCRRHAGGGVLWRQAVTGQPRAGGWGQGQMYPPQHSTCHAQYPGLPQTMRGSLRSLGRAALTSASSSCRCLQPWSLAFTLQKTSTSDYQVRARSPHMPFASLRMLLACTPHPLLVSLASGRSAHPGLTTHLALGVCGCRQCPAWLTQQLLLMSTFSGCHLSVDLLFVFSCGAPDGAALQAFDSPSLPPLARLGIDVDWNADILWRVSGWVGGSWR